MDFIITSPAFNNGGKIPLKYTCDGENVSLPLRWQNTPGNTKSFALIADDPDAPLVTWVHWVIFNIPAASDHLKENIPAKGLLPDGIKQGLNDFQNLGYGGPCPPSGTHRYYFKLYALDTLLDLEAGITKEELLTDMEGHILGRAELMGTYKR